MTGRDEGEPDVRGIEEPIFTAGSDELGNEADGGRGLEASRGVSSILGRLGDDPPCEGSSLRGAAGEPGGGDERASVA